MTNLREPRTEAGRRLLNAPHVVEFSRTGYGLQHPISCRPDLLGCKLNKWLARQSQPVCAPGRYLMAGIGRFQSLPPDYTDPLVPDAILAIEAEAAAVTPAPGGVHNHGIEDDPGVSCSEHLIGACRLAEAAEAQVAAQLAEANDMAQWSGGIAEGEQAKVAALDRRLRILLRLIFDFDVDESGCWLWRGSVKDETRAPYGQFSFDGITISAHRAMAEAAFGPIPEGMFVCHCCDTGRCINPRHLYVGDRLTNAADAVERGQMATGDRNGTRTHPERVARGRPRDGIG